MASLRDKRFVLIALVTIALALYFWIESRYPSLNQKAMMGADAPIAGIAFSPLIDIPADEPLVPRILKTFVNWIYTNRQGMTFSVFFGAAVMTLLGLFRHRSFRSRFANSAMGMAIGTPLGVCVNCAAPIAKGMYAGGARAETMLAAMVSSPTLNVVVLTMLLALFPPYVAFVKIGLTVALILVGIPLLTWLFRTPEAVAAGGAGRDESALPPKRIGGPLPVDMDPPRVGAGSTWVNALKWLGISYGSNFWYIVKTTVPLMFLAGFLGSLMITFVPLEALVNALPSTGGRGALFGMSCLALVGLFLPVPMTFDVIVTAVLWQAGLPVKYAMVLLFTLGVFSVYSYFIVWQSIGARVATSLAGALVVLGLVAGAAADQLSDWDTQRQRQVFFEVFSKTAAALRGPKVVRIGGEAREQQPDGQIVPALRQAALAPESLGPARDRISVERFPFQAPVGQAGAAKSPALFTRVEGRHLGLDEPSSFSVLRFEGPFAQFRGIASGDVHNDGWVDLLFTSDAGISLYANRQGRFVLQQADIPEMKDFYVTNAALVDLNGDGWLDIVFSAYRHGNYVIYNREGRFTRESYHRLPRPDEAMVTGAMAFGDIDRNGTLDVVMGSWVAPCRSWQPCDDRAANNFVLRNDKGQFQVLPLPGLPGRQTISVLLSDFSGDGLLDLVIGNEDPAPDIFMLGKGDGAFRQITSQDAIIPHSTGSTMSVASGDIDNDLRTELYIGQISGASKHHVKQGPEVCDEIAEPAHRKACRDVMVVHASMPSPAKTRDVQQCLTSAELAEFREDCIAYSLLLWSRTTGPQSLCDLFSEKWDAFKFNCRQSYTEKLTELTTVRSGKPLPPGSIPVNYKRNVLLAPTGDGRFQDKAVEMGVNIAGFTWNAKFADVDNDEFIDLYAVNGWFPDPGRESHLFYRNRQGKGFVDESKQSGLTSFLPTSAYTYVDLDNDGDLDIVAVPVVGPVLVYLNNSTRGRIAFELRDEAGNRTGIGSKVTVHYGPGGARHQVREIQAGGGFLSFDAPVAYFGLGEFQQVERVEVQWSTGERSEIRGDFAAGARYRIRRQG
jgi:uncharacterized membrane protein YraQ (UPF0718 family)